MSRSSVVVGDLVPRDVTEVLAQQSRGSKGRGRKRGSSLGRAFGWLRPAPRPRSSSTGPNRTANQNRPAENSTARTGLTHPAGRAGPKEDEQNRLTVHYTASQHYQENVFIEGSRPKHLQDLHIEAQEGLKILLQEEHKNGVDFQTDQTNSTGGPWPDRDASVCHREESECPGSAAANSSTSAGSSVSDRPLLTRQGSTFKPLNPVRRPERNKKRTRRTTIMGIPQQVQRELVMQRAALPQQQRPTGDGVDSLDVVIIPTIDGETPAPNHEGVRVHLQSIEALQASREEQILRQHLQALYRDDLVLAHRCGPRTSPLQRPKSLAVPGLTSYCSFLQEPLGPVMSVSPQATYLSKIIPNAILPAAVDVIQIDRSRSRGSMRTVSKNSLASASPPPSTSSRSGEDTVEPHSSSSSSHCSQSQSSETVVSNSSTVSSKGASTTPTPVECPKEGASVSMAHSSTRTSLSSFCSDRKGTCQRSESRVATVAEVDDDNDEDDDYDDGENVRNSQTFTRSLSVMKTKQPPAPPRRTYSLHHEKVKRRSKELVDVKNRSNMEGGKGQNVAKGSNIEGVKRHDQPKEGGTEVGKGQSVSIEGSTSAVRGESPNHSSSSSTVTEDSQTSSISSPLSPKHDHSSMADQCETSSSLQRNSSTAESKFDRTLSPSSGYSSQSGTPTLSPKEICPPSPDRQKIKPPKPERSSSRTATSVSDSSLVTNVSSGESDPVRRSSTPNTTPPQTLKTPPVTSPPHITVNLRDLLNIPPPPKVKAPSPPPPETWAHNAHTFELLCGPPPNTKRILQMQRQMQETVHQTQSQEPNLQNQLQEGVHQIQTQETPVQFAAAVAAAAASDPKMAACGWDKNVSQVENQGSEQKVKEEQVPVQTPNDRLTKNVIEPPALTTANVVAGHAGWQESQDVDTHARQKESQDVYQSEEACLEADKLKISEVSNKAKGPPARKKEPPPVMKKSIRIKQGQRPEEALQSIKEHKKLKEHTNTQQSIQGNANTLQSVLGHTNTLASIQRHNTVKCAQGQTTTVKSEQANIASTEVPMCPSLGIPPSLPKVTDTTSTVQATTGSAETECLTPEGVCVDSARINSPSPPPSPPPEHHPPPPPLKTSPPTSTSASSLPPEEEQDPLLKDSVWPPPPPPLEELPEFGDGQEEADFPPPPPPFSQQTLSELLDDSQLEANQENQLKHLDMSVVDEGEDISSALQKSKEELQPGEPALQSPVTALPVLPEAEQLEQNHADHVVIDVQSGEHLPEGFEAMGLCDLGTAPSEEMTQALAEQPLLSPETWPLPQDIPSPIEERPLPTQEIAPLSQRTVPSTPVTLLPTDDVPPPPQEAAPPPPSTNESECSPEPKRSDSTGLSLLAPPVAHGPATPPPPAEGQATLNFRRQSSLLGRESRNKELLSRNKSTAIPKEDANIPLVTPSLLQMVRLRAVGVGEDQVVTTPPDQSPKADGTQSQDQTVPQKPTSSDQAIPQKPIRKSLSLKATSPAAKVPVVPASGPSLRLQEAIRLKTAAMSSRDTLPARLCLRSSLASLHSSDTLSPGGGDMHKSPASTASFIFSKSTKKVVIETTTIPEAQTSLKQSLAAELKQVSDQAKHVAANGTNKLSTLPPPVTKKPPLPHGSNEANGGVNIMQTASQQAQTADDSAGGADRTNSIEVS